MLSLKIIFWVLAATVFYAYLGYGIVLILLVKIKEAVHGRKSRVVPEQLPEVTLLIAAYNEQDVVTAKMQNCHEIEYPSELLKIVWVTDGSTDDTNKLLGEYKDVRVIFEPERGGKAAALNHAMQSVTSPIVVFTDANTMICSRAVIEMVSEFSNAEVGCVAGEKRVVQHEVQDATAGEGIYWRYESLLKRFDYRLYSAVGAAGELFAVRRELFETLPSTTLLDDFVVSLRIAMHGYRIAYCSEAYALEEGSANIVEENKRKVRIAAGGLQAVCMLRGLLNPFRYGVLSFQYVSHRVMRWTVAPIALVLLVLLNVAIVVCDGYGWLYTVLLALQVLFYVAALGGYMLDRKALRSKYLFVPYYFTMMNLNVFKAYAYLRRNRGKGAWEKAKRAS